MDEERDFAPVYDVAGALSGAKRPFVIRDQRQGSGPQGES